jgi:hypothetical protein
MFQVQRHLCSTCIYRRDNPLDLARLEAANADPHMPGFFATYRECHHAPHHSGVCCAGFYRRYKECFALGQIAQRLGLVEYVDVDVFASEKMLHEERHE